MALWQDLASHQYGLSMDVLFINWIIQFLYRMISCFINETFCWLKSVCSELISQVTRRLFIQLGWGFLCNSAHMFFILNILWFTHDQYLLNSVELTDQREINQSSINFHSVVNSLLFKEAWSLFFNFWIRTLESGHHIYFALLQFIWEY